MVQYMPRSAWTSSAPGGATLTAAKLVGVTCHYPASGNITLAGLTADQVASRLRGWRAYHLSRGWSDIGYQVAVDGAGRVWDLRGIGRVPAASASESNPDANQEWGACLWIVGDSEPPTPAAVEAFQHWRFTRWLVRWPAASRILGHGQVPGASTACPGSRIRALITGGILTQRPDPTPEGDDDMPTPTDVWNHVIAFNTQADTMLSQCRTYASDARAAARDGRDAVREVDARLARIEALLTEALTPAVEVDPPS
jgi:hypothetical protein